MEFRTYFVNFHTFSYKSTDKFKVQRTLTYFGPPVFSPITKLILKYDWITARGYCPFCYNPSKGREWGIGRGWGGGGEGVSKEICGTVRLPV